MRREGIETPNPLIKRRQRSIRSGRAWACKGAKSRTPTDVTALLSPLLSRLGSSDCFGVRAESVLGIGERAASGAYPGSLTSASAGWLADNE